MRKSKKIKKKEIQKNKKKIQKNQEKKKIQKKKIQKKSKKKKKNPKKQEKEFVFSSLGQNVSFIFTLFLILSNSFESKTLFFVVSYFSFMLIVFSY